jgi:hypothetical protein
MGYSVREAEAYPTISATKSTPGTGTGATATAEPDGTGSPLNRRTRARAALARRYRRLPTRVRRIAPVLLILGTYLVLALWADAHQLVDPYHRISGHLPTDNIQAEWFLAHAARGVTHPGDLLLDHQMNAPAGVNMMANTSVLLVGLPLVPVTLLFGPQISYLCYLILALTLSAFSAYAVIYRRLVRSRFAAFIGGAFFGFAPGVIHHANGQPNFVANFLLPWIALATLRLAAPPATREPKPLPGEATPEQATPEQATPEQAAPEPESAEPGGDKRWGTAIRRGTGLGLLVFAQVFVNEELLLITAVTLCVVIAVYAVMRRHEARAKFPMLWRGGLVAVAVAAPLLLFPVWFQFRGPRSYHGIPAAFLDWGEDITAFFTYSRDTIAGSVGPERTIGFSEQNTWFGAPLVVLIALMVVLLWRSSFAARVATVVGVLFAVIGLGPYLRVDGVRHYHLLLPYRLFERLPLVNNMYASRWNYAVIACVAVMLALACDRVPTMSVPASPVPVRRLWYLALAVALVPLVPKPMPVKTAPVIPAFIASGEWRHYVDDRHSLVNVPLPDNKTGIKGMLWSAVTTEAYKSAEGYYLGPDANGEGMFGSPLRPTSRVLAITSKSGTRPEVTPEMRADLRTDLRYWHAAVLVLDINQVNMWPLYDTVTALTGITPVLTGGVWLWNVRPMTDGAAS